MKKKGRPIQIGSPPGDGSGSNQNEMMVNIFTLEKNFPANQPGPILANHDSFFEDQVLRRGHHVGSNGSYLKTVLNSG